MKNEKKIVITGIGPLTAGGSGNEEVWDSIVNRRTGLVEKEYKIDNEKLGKFFVHEIKDFDIKNYDIDRQILDEIESWKMGDKITDFYYFLATIKMAIDDAGLKINKKNNDSTGLILAHENMGMDDFYLKVIDKLSFTGKDKDKRPITKKDFLTDFYEKFHRTGYELQTFMSLHHIAKVFDIHGHSLFLNNACASGLFALEAANEAIRSGKCEQMIVAAVDNSSIFKQLWFKDTKCLAKDGKTKPFASDRDGFTIGDGGAALVIESMENAKERKADIYAEYTGGSSILEGWKVTYPDITNDLYKKMIQKAIKISGINAEKVDLVIPHGVGTNVTDRYEAEAIDEIFGKKPVITALKPYVGHTLGSTALLETAIMLLGLKNNKIPPTLNSENKDTKLDINLLKNVSDASDVRIAMKTACGFAGFNSACVFSVH